MVGLHSGVTLYFIDLLFFQCLGGCFLAMYFTLFYNFNSFAFLAWLVRRLSYLLFIGSLFVALPGPPYVRIFSESYRPEFFPVLAVCSSAEYDRTLVS